MSSTSAVTVDVEPAAIELRATDLMVAEEAFEVSDETQVALQKQRWNDPAVNKWRVFMTFAGFAVLGAGDGVYGALIPYIRKDFNLSNTVVSLIFVTPFAGYFLSSIALNKLCMTFGQRGIAIIGGLCHLIPFTVMSVHPPFPVYLTMYVFVGLGNGLIDAAWNAWIGDMVNANALMGVLHAFYGLGAMISPTIATAMINRGLDWWKFYYTMASGAAFELLGGASAFWGNDSEQFRLHNPKTADATGGSRTKQAAINKVTWVVAIFLFIYVGIEVSVSGWVVDFMMKVRHGAAFESGIIPTGFWAGITIGRLILGFATEALGERLSIFIYLLLCIGLELIFWLVPTFVVSAVAVSFLGVFMGPLFPGAMVVAAKLLPKHLHTAAVGMACAFAGGGGAMLPFVAGAIAQPHGVQSLQPYVLALLVVLTSLWLLLPRKSQHAHEG